MYYRRRRELDQGEVAGCSLLGEAARHGRRRLIAKHGHVGKLSLVLLDDRSHDLEVEIVVLIRTISHVLIKVSPDHSDGGIKVKQWAITRFQNWILITDEPAEFARWHVSRRQLVRHLQQGPKSLTV
jgi:hypothetical protein